MRHVIRNWVIAAWSQSHTSRFLARPYDRASARQPLPLAPHMTVATPIPARLKTLRS